VRYRPRTTARGVAPRPSAVSAYPAQRNCRRPAPTCSTHGGRAANTRSTVAFPTHRDKARAVAKGQISEDQLAQALEDQQATGQKLGEILIAKYGLSRLELAGALDEQWTEVEAGPAGDAADTDSPTVSGLPPQVQTVLAKLEETVALGAVLKRTTDDLDSRLAAVETLLVALTGAIDELLETTVPTHAQIAPI
jgi:hypothetical protein